MMLLFAACHADHATPPCYDAAIDYFDYLLIFIEIVDNTYLISLRCRLRRAAIYAALMLILMLSPCCFIDYAINITIIIFSPCYAITR